MNILEILKSNEKHFWGSVIVFAIILVFSLFTFFLIKFENKKKKNFLEKPKGFISVIELIVEKIDIFVKENFGEKSIFLSGYLLSVSTFILFSFLIGVIGVNTKDMPMPFANPLSSLDCTLSLSLCSFLLIHFFSIRYRKLQYFKRYIKPIFIFLPINLLTMWEPLLSLALRLFGNIFAGSILTDRVYTLPYIFFFVLPFFHVYFDFFSGLIQIFIFVYLSTMFISQEKK